MIAAIRFRNFKALRSTQVRFEAFNLLLGPNGSGKTSLIQALARLRALAAQTAAHTRALAHPREGGPQIEFTFAPPFDGIRLSTACAREELVCDTLVVDHPPGAAGERLWDGLRERLLTIRVYLFDHAAMGQPAATTDAGELAANGGNLAAVLAGWHRQAPGALAALEAEFRRIVPEFQRLEFRAADGGRVAFGARVGGNGDVVPAEDLSQGTLHILGILALAYQPAPPAVLCLEEADRGVHPRMLREVRDALYRLTYPKDSGFVRQPVQVVATTHSPYLLDLFRDHPEEVVLASKQGRAATFERLSDRPDLVEMMHEANLGDLWYSGILGGVPGEL